MKKNINIKEKIISKNRKANFHYNIMNTYECGIVLLGSEVKSLREKHINFMDSYALLKNREVFLIGLNIEPYKNATHENHDVDRTRKLMLKRKEINKISRLINDKGLTLIPLKIYFVNNIVKLMIALAKGKNKSDKRNSIKKREAKIEISRVLKYG